MNNQFSNSCKIERIYKRAFTKRCYRKCNKMRNEDEIWNSAEMKRKKLELINILMKDLNFEKEDLEKALRGWNRENIEYG
ncbi:hypothetical protein AKJ43_01750 [candidate division MSBL1 archaeon SCGC-AAA261D19]|uniref:Uncharacterized protein n=1 Tax=candidate division MSBL1 archaeon SCGC-AAA261D19 TaxID=1698273 RepID=A0A133V7M5_9EURY|nr:hypothetical protein AKJ43_01750 [candidate division MSBL1 archaeon SCGC-AAA261D19]